MDVMHAVLKLGLVTAEESRVSLSQIMKLLSSPSLLPSSMVLWVPGAS